MEGIKSGLTEKGSRQNDSNQITTGFVSNEVYTEEGGLMINPEKPPDIEDLM